MKMCAEPGCRKLAYRTSRWCNKHRSIRDYVVQSESGSRQRANERNDLMRRKTFGVLVGGALVAAILEFQGGVCAICKRRLILPKYTGYTGPTPHMHYRGQCDHDHAIWDRDRDSLDDHPKILASIRGVLDRTCNRTLVEKRRGWLAFADEINAYLSDPPAQRYLRARARASRN